MIAHLCRLWLKFAPAATLLYATRTSLVAIPTFVKILLNVSFWQLLMFINVGNLTIAVLTALTRLIFVIVCSTNGN